MGRKLRSTFDSMHPQPNTTRTTDNTTLDRPDVRRESRKRTFARGDLIWALCFQRGMSKWAPGYILRRRGKVLYEISLNGKFGIRHINQLKPRYVDIQSKNPVKVELNELLNTRMPPHNPQTQDSPAQKPIRRYPQRERKRVEPLKVNPRKKHMCSEAIFEGGGVTP